MLRPHLSADDIVLAKRIGDLEAHEKDLKRRRRSDLRLALRRKTFLGEVGEIAVLLMALPGGDTAVAKEYVAKMAPRDEAEIWERVRLEHAALSVTQKDDLIHPDPAVRAEGRLCRKAEKFLKDQKLASWVRRQSVLKGLAPVTAELLREGVEHGCLASSSDCKYKSQKQWGRRWRKRFDMTMGRFTGREQLPDVEAQAKVLSNFKNQIANRTLSTSFFRCWVVIERTQHRGHYVDPNLGSRVRNTEKQCAFSDPHSGGFDRQNLFPGASYVAVGELLAQLRSGRCIGIEYQYG